MKAASPGKLNGQSLLLFPDRLLPAPSGVFQAAALRVGREKRRRGGVGHGKAPVPLGGDEREAGWESHRHAALPTQQRESGKICRDRLPPSALHPCWLQQQQQQKISPYTAMWKQEEKAGCSCSAARSYLLQKERTVPKSALL